MRRFIPVLVYATLFSFNLTAQQVVQGFYAVTHLAPLPLSTNTADKPQSKVWSYAGKHWAVLPNENGTFLWRLDGTTWTNVLSIPSSSNAKADCKVVGNMVHMLLFRGANAVSYQVSLEYIPALKNYQLWSRRTERVPTTLNAEVETASMDIDGTGRMWVAYDGISDIQVQWSDPPYETWSEPITLATGITDDDLCGIIALPGKIGVLWSNQNTRLFGFRTHTDGAAPSDWSADETPASQSALNIGKGMADDHLNMASTSDGTLYCAVKTSYDISSYPKLSLLVRRPSGTWDNLYKVTNSEGTRPIVLLNEAFGKIKIVYTSAERGGNILYRESALTRIAFSPPFTLIKGFHNYVTSSKDNYSTDVVILATNMNPVAQNNYREAVGVLATDSAGVYNYLEDEDGELLAYPNPLQPHSVISYALHEGGKYTLALYDSKGTLVSRLEEGYAVAGELYTIEVSNATLKGGLYVVRLEAVEGTKILKLLVDK